MILSMVFNYPWPCISLKSVYSSPLHFVSTATLCILCGRSIPSGAFLISIAQKYSLDSSQYVLEFHFAFVFLVLGIEPVALYMPGKCSATELCPTPSIS